MLLKNNFMHFKKHFYLKLVFSIYPKCYGRRTRDNGSSNALSVSNQTCLTTGENVIQVVHSGASLKVQAPAASVDPELAGAQNRSLETDMLCSMFTYIFLFLVCVIIKKVVVTCRFFMTKKRHAAG